MNEFPIYNSMEQIASISPLNRLDQELSAVTDKASLDIALSKYIAEEMSMTNDEASHALRLLEKSGTFPLQSTLIRDDRMMTPEDEYRVGIFTGIMPLYQMLHTTDQYEEWLPRALDVVLPVDGNHGTHANCHTVIDDYACWTQEVCPLKKVIEKTKESSMQPDFKTFDYIARREEMYAQVMILHATLKQREILTRTQERELTKVYTEKYNQAFSVSR